MDLGCATIRQTAASCAANEGAGLDGKLAQKVIVRTHANQVLAGYLPSAGLLDGTAQIALLDLEAHIVHVAQATVRWIAYVRDFNLDDVVDPERLSRRVFLARPRAEGLWVRLTMVGADLMEGLAPIDISLLDAMRDDGGIFLTPPDVRSNTQRLFVPRTAFTAMQLVAVITTPSKIKPAEAPSRPGQSNLFAA